MASFLALPVDTLGDIGAFLCSADRRTLARVSRGLRNTAVSLWPDDVAVNLKGRVLHYMCLDAAFCALVRNTLFLGPLAPLPINAKVDCCKEWNMRKSITSAEEGFAIEEECGVCGALGPFSHLPAMARELACVAGFHRVDVKHAQSLEYVAQLASVNTLVLEDCGVSGIACLGQSATLRKVVLSRCDDLTALPHIRFLQRAEVRHCRALTSVDALAHAREVVLEVCEGVRDVSPLASVHAIAIERRENVLTDVSALFLGRVHSLVLHDVVISHLPEGAGVHSLTLSRVRVLRGQQLPRKESRFVSSRRTGDDPYASVDLALLSLRSLSLCYSPLPPFDSTRRPSYPDDYTPQHGFDVLSATLMSVRLVVNSDAHFDLSWACRLSRVVIEVGQSHELSLAPLANVRYVTVRGYDESVYGLLAAVASAMREAPADVDMQRHGCGALAGRRWSIGWKGDRFHDESYASAVLGAIASFPTDEEVMHCGLRSLAKMVAPNVTKGTRSRNLCEPEWVEVARACLGRDGLPPACVAAALSLLFKAAASAFCSPANDGARELRDALPLDEMARAAVRAARAWPDDRVVLEAAAQTFEFCALVLRLAGRQRVAMYAGHLPSWLLRANRATVFPCVAANTRQDRSWVSAAVGVALALAQLCPLDRRVPSVQLPMNLLAAVADIDRSCALELVRAGVLDMLLERAVAWLDTSSVDNSWFSPLGRLAQYACDDADDHAPALVSADAMLDVVRRLSRRNAISSGNTEWLELLFAGESPFPSRESLFSYGNQRDELIVRVMHRHRFDCDLGVACALAYDSSVFRSHPALHAGLYTYVARSPHLEWRNAPNILSLEDSATAIGCDGGGFAYLSAVIRTSLSRECDGENAALGLEHLCKLAEGLCVLVASGEDGGRDDAVDAALDDCVACLGMGRLWDPDHRSCVHAIARATSLLLLAKCRPDRNAMAPVTLCALAATAAVGLKPLLVTETMRLKVPLAIGSGAVATPAFVDLRELFMLVEALAECSACEGLRASGTLLSRAARMAFPGAFVYGVLNGPRRVATIVVDVSAESDVYVARSLLKVVARGGLLAAAKTKDSSRSFTHGSLIAAATILALSAMDGQQRASLVENVRHTMRTLRRFWAACGAVPLYNVEEASLAALDELQKLLRPQ